MMDVSTPSLHSPIQPLSVPGELIQSPMGPPDLSHMRQAADTPLTLTGLPEASHSERTPSRMSSHTIEDVKPS